MAGEWIPVDCNLGTKPEVLELVDETGLPIEVVCWRLIQLWSWAALNSSDGTIRATPRRVAAVAGGDEAFWLAVERVGWVSFLSGTIVIEGWQKRFSQAAKARATHAKRQDSYRWRSRDGGPSQGCDAQPSQGGDGAASLQEKTGQERREEEIQPAAPVPTSDPPKASRKPAKPRISWDSESGWEGITDSDRQQWATAYPGAVIDQELAKATAWLTANPSRAGRRNWRRFLVGWLQRCQDKGGTNRTPGVRPEEKPPPKAWRDEYRPAPYRTPKEVAALAQTLKLKDEDT
jgi:hypothetical protein